MRITLKAFQYEHIKFNPKHKKWSIYCGKASELLVTDKRLCITFTVGGDRKPLGKRFVASDLNFSSIDFTAFNSGRLEGAWTDPLKRLVQIQNDFSRRRRRLQLRIKNPAKRARKLRETRGGQRNKVKDTLHKLSTRMVRENLDASFIFEDLNGIRRNGRRRKQASKKLRTYLNRWPYRLYQSMAQYKSRHKTLYVRPGGTSSKCPVCGGGLKHPAWAVSRCDTCGVDYDRNRLSSLEILLRVYAYAANRLP